MTQSPQAPHPDFLGTASQDSPYLQDTLGLVLNFDAYSFNMTDDTAHLSQLTTDPTLNNPDPNSTWATSSQHPPDSLLFTTTTPYLSELALASASPSTSAVGLHDTYYPHGHQSFLYNTSTPVRHVPRIHVETELSATSATSTPYDPHSPFRHSPTGAHSPSVRISYVHTSSPSSVGSAPPVTPETPYTTISPNASPFISQASGSPVSPSPFINGQAVGFDPKDPLSIHARQETSVLDIAARLGHPLGGVLVPQKTYRPHTLSDRRRYVEEVQLEEPIMFYTHTPIGCGILLKDAFSSRYSTLEGRDDAMFVGRGPSVSIRLNWPGYAPWSRQIPTRDFRSPPHPITRAKLARNVAKTILRFIQDMETQNQEDASEARWRVGSKGIQLDDLVLVGLQHVSMGSWQAHVRLIPRRR